LTLSGLDVAIDYSLLLVSRWRDASTGERHLLSLLRGHRMKRLLSRMLDETGICPSYGQVKAWSYSCKFPTVRVGNRAGVAERDGPAAKVAILALITPKKNPAT